MDVEFQRILNKVCILFKSRKMLQKLGERGLWKLGMYFMYLCAQVLILGTLMLTTNSMVAHTLMMILTIALYFAVCFKDPGKYIANPEPNLEDISNNPNKNDVRKNSKKKILSVRIHEKDMNDVIRQQKKESSFRKPHKKTSFQQKVELERADQLKSEQKELSLKVPCNNNEEAAKAPNNITASARNILSVAKNAIGNLASFMSKKNLDNISADGKPNTEAPDAKSARSIRVQPQEDHPHEINIITTPQQSEQEKKQQQKQQEKMDAKVGEEAVIDRERLHLEQPSWKAKTIVEKMTENKRYCRICEFYQPLRVRHCHSCEQCVATFDHHCPWLSTCIGEKNKLAFIGYLFAQTLQFLVISIDLIRYLSVSRSESAPAGILLLAVILIFLVLLLLLIFHIYLAVNNLTTWQLFRWDKIQYLSLFDKKLIRSPFSQGWKKNVKTLWRVTVSDELKKWQEELPQDLSKFVLKGKGSRREREGATERKMFQSQGNI